MRISSTIAMPLLVAVLAVSAGCAEDPAVRKQQYFESGNRYFEQAQYAHAIIEYRNAVDIDPRFGDARARLAEAYARSGDLRNAFGEYVRAADLLPERIDVQLTAGVYLLAAGRAEDALARADAAIAREPQNIQAHVLRGNALAGQKSVDEAIAAIEEAIRIDPQRFDTALILNPRVTETQMLKAILVELGETKLARSQNDLVAQVNRVLLDRIEKALKPSFPGSRYEELAHQLDDATAAKIEGLNLPGIHLRLEPKRIYRAARGEVLQALLALRLAHQSAAATADGFALGAFDVRAADRTGGWQLKLGGIALAALMDRLGIDPAKVVGGLGPGDVAEEDRPAAALVGRRRARQRRRDLIGGLVAGPPVANLIALLDGAAAGRLAAGSHPRRVRPAGAILAGEEHRIGNPLLERLDLRAGRQLDLGGAGRDGGHRLEHCALLFEHLQRGVAHASRAGAARRTDFHPAGRGIGGRAALPGRAAGGGRFRSRRRVGSMGRKAPRNP